MTDDISTLIERLVRLVPTSAADAMDTTSLAAAGLLPDAADPRGPARSGGQAPTYQEISGALGIPILRTETAGDMEYFKGELERGPLGGVELRRNRTTGLGILILHPRQGEPTHKGQLVLDRYGPPEPHISPDIPPEGAISFVYRIGKTELAFQFTATSLVLLAISLNWPGRGAA
jgi:hypothetical protein